MNIVWALAFSGFVALAMTDELQPEVGDPVQEAGNRVVQASKILFAGGCTHVFRCEEILRDTEEGVEDIVETIKR